MSFEPCQNQVVPIPWSMPSILTVERTSDAVAHLQQYFGRTWYPPGQENRGYTGGHFEDIGGRWNTPEAAFTITPADLVAVTCLSVSIPAHAAIRILGPEANAISALLHEIPTDLDLWNALDEHLDDDSPAGRLWRLLRGSRDMGPTTTSKLIARKRARLAPIYDDVVRSELGLRNSRGYWTGMRDLLNREVEPGKPLHDHLTELAREAKLDPVVTPLRVLDVVVWKDGRSRWRQR